MKKSFTVSEFIDSSSFESIDNARFDLSFDEVKSYAEDLLDYAQVPDELNFNDFDRDSIDDLVHVYADSLVNIYYHDIYKDCAKFAVFTDEALEEYCIETGTPLYKILQIGEYKYYSDLFSEILNALTEFVENNSPQE